MADANHQNNNAMDQLGMLRGILLQPTIDKIENDLQRVRETIAQHKEAADNQLDSSNTHFSDALDSLEKRLSAQLQANHEELMAEIRKLQHAKLDRMLLGQMLMDVGNKISE